MLIDVPRNSRMCSCLAPDLELVTVIIVNSAESLYRPQTWGSSSKSGLFHFIYISLES
jgi:hypothetical protein